MFDSGGTMLDGGSFGSPQFSTCWQTFLGGAPIIKDFIVDVLVGQVLKGVPYLHLTLWLLSDVCYADRGSATFSLSGRGGGNSSIYVKGLPAVLEGMGRLVCSTGCTQPCHLSP